MAKTQVPGSQIADNTISLTPGVGQDVTGTLPTANGGTGLASPGTNGNVLQSNGTIWTSADLAAAVAAVLDAEKITPTLANATTTTETEVIKFAIPANYFTTELLLDLTFMSTLSSTATLTWKIYCGTLGTKADPLLIAYDPSPASTGTTSHQTGKLLVRCITTGASGTVTAGGYITNGIDLGDGIGPVQSVTFAPATVNTTIANVITVTVKQSASNTLTMRAANLHKMRG